MSSKIGEQAEPTTAPTAPAQPASIARHGRLKPRGVVAPIAKATALAIAAMLVSVVTVGGYAIGTTLSQIRPGVKLLRVDDNGPPPQIGSASGQINLLIVGSDTRSNQGSAFSDPANLGASSGAGNNDVTMVVHISDDHQSAEVVSIPRDLVTTLPSCVAPNGGILPAYTGMFNTTLWRGGLGCVASAAEQLTGLKIPFAVEFTFDGVIAMSNAIGGITVCVASPINDPYVGLNLAAGKQTLVGSDALAFVRSRYGVGNGGDLGRISNQQLFLSALLRKVTSQGTLSNPLELYALARAATQSLQLSDTLSDPFTLVSLALALKNIPLSRFVFLQYPTIADPSDPNRVVPAAGVAALLKQSLMDDTPVALTGGTGAATEPNPNPDPEPAATPAPPKAGGLATGTPAATPTTPPPPTSAPPSQSTVMLPSTVTGQTAAEQTCTIANSR